MELLHLARRPRLAAAHYALLLASGLAIGGAPAARADEGLTLAEAVSRALRDGYGARIARLVAGRAEDAFRERRGSYLPHVFATSGAGTSNRRNETFLAFDDDGALQEFGIASLASNEGFFNLFVEQLLFDAKQWKLIERERLKAEVARISENREREKVTRNVVRTFAEIVRLQRLEELAQRQRADARWLDDQAQKLHQAGRALRTEREIVALHLAESEMEAHTRAAEAGEARAALWLAIAGGERAGTPVAVAADSLPEPALDLTPTGAEEAVAGAPELRALELRQRVAEASVSAAAARRLPTLGLRGGYTHYGTDRFDLYDDELRVGIDLRVPIFDGFEAKRAISGARKGVEIARLRYQSTLEAKRNRVRELVRRLESAAQRLQLAERGAETSRERQRLTDLRLRSQRASLEESVTARERSARDAREAIDSFFTRFELWSALQQEMGRLSSVIIGNGATSAP